MAEANSKANKKALEESIDFCTMPQEKLVAILKYLEIDNILRESEMETIIKNEEIIEKKWTWYDDLRVTPKTIYFSVDPYPAKIIFTTEKYAEMMALIADDIIMEFDVAIKDKLPNTYKPLRDHGAHADFCDKLNDIRSEVKKKYNIWQNY